MTEILDGKALSLQIKDEMANEVRRLMSEGYRAPHLAAVLVGDDGASKTYIASKEKGCNEVGFTSSVYRYPATMSEKELLEVVDFLNNDRQLDGYIVQLPLPKQINETKVVHAINPFKDVDGFTPINIGRLVLGEDCFVPATPKGIVTLLQRFNIETQGKHCVVVGRSNIVGTPMANLMIRKANWANCTVTVCHSRTKNLPEITRMADILIVAIGKPEFITGDMVKKGAVVIDVGIHRIPDETRKSGYHICGDVKHDEVDQLCSHVTPVPGGVGPLTIVSLLENTMKAYKNHLGIK